ncbi:hypothetical protein TNCV_975521 [Trichonephila clavipes]|nr:hypothetical protein TNCV_975521 [Trichonephila clavipes]
MIFAAFSPNKFNEILGLNLSVTLLATNARSNDKKKKLHPSGLSGIFTVSVRILLIKESIEKESLQLTSVLLSLSFARILRLDGPECWVTNDTLYHLEVVVWFVVSTRTVHLRHVQWSTQYRILFPEFYDVRNHGRFHQTPLPWQEFLRYVHEYGG